MDTPPCRYCKGKLVSRGKHKSGNFQYQCKRCGKWQSLSTRRSARILLLDIETLPGEYYSWSPKPEYLQPDMMIKDWSISCWAAKFLFESEIMGEVVSPKEAFERTEKSILGGIWELMNESDIIVTQNGINFDIKRLNSKFIENGYKPPSRYLNVDTLKVAQGVFGFTYNRLNELGKKFGIGEKTEMNFQDWKNCLTNDKEADKALKHKLEYCKRDVAPLLEDVYLTMLPWIPNHPNLNLFTNHDKDACPKCESLDLDWLNLKPYTTPQGVWVSFRCNSCGATGRGTKKDDKVKSVSLR